MEFYMNQYTLPQDIHDCLRNKFNFSQDIVCAQAATQSKEGPHVRTMGLLDIRDQRELIFSSHAVVQKWRDLQDDPRISLCFLLPDYSIQLLAFGTATLYSGPEHAELLQQYWPDIRDDIKKAYVNDHVPNQPYRDPGNLPISTDVPINFGLIAIVPQAWELMELNDDYLASHRYRFHLDDNQQWQKQRLTLS